MQTPSVRLCALATAALTLAACGGTSAPEADPRAAAAASTRVVSLLPLSGPSPFAPQGCGQPENPIYAVIPDDIDYGDGKEFGDEADASLVVNPRNPRHLVASWSQDAALGILTATSFDGGRTWQRTQVPELSYCDGTDEERHIHTRLAFGPDERIYLATEADDGFFPDPRQGVTQRIPVAHSIDGGLTWSKSFVDAGGARDAFKGLSTIAAEPDVPGAAVVAWHVGEPQLATGTVLMSRTTDGGATWTRQVVRQGSADDLPFSRVLPLRNGDLLMFAADSSVRGFAVTGTPAAFAAPAKPLSVQRSTDKGMTWSEPVIISADSTVQWPAALEGPDGTIYVSWTGVDGGQAIARSSDHGATWGVVATDIARSDHGMNPALALNDDGVLGFVYTDHRGATPEQRDTWLAYSLDGGVTWNEQHIGAHLLLDRDLGLIQETIGTASGFAAVFVAGPPLAIDGATDVMYVELRTPKATRTP